MKSRNILILFLSMAFMATSCDDSKEYEIKSTDKYEKGKVSLSDVEKEKPARFLTVSGNNKRNILGQTVINGKLINSAKIITYKDIDVKLSFYSKTGALLEEDHEVIYESVQPGGSKTFKSKYFAPKGTDSVAMVVIAAKY
ncbi:MAG: hypothetical protein JWQ27_931 [Ferruginibacter sp.]|nr:hypothetical protein [Ferruginibacter sp.]